MATASNGMQKLFEVGTKIVAVGRNYAAHAKELGNAVPKVTTPKLYFPFSISFQFLISTTESINQEPVLFLKPTSSYLQNGGTIEVPHPLESLHHEVELAVVIGKRARDVPETTAMDYVGGYFHFHI